MEYFNMMVFSGLGGAFMVLGIINLFLYTFFNRTNKWLTVATASSMLAFIGYLGFTFVEYVSYNEGVTNAIIEGVQFLFFRLR